MTVLDFFEYLSPALLSIAVCSAGAFYAHRHLGRALIFGAGAGFIYIVLWGIIMGTLSLIFSFMGASNASAVLWSQLLSTFACIGILFLQVRSMAGSAHGTYNTPDRAKSNNSFSKRWIR